MNYEELLKEGCKMNNLDKVKEALSHMNLYYLNKQIVGNFFILCKNNSSAILEYILEEFKKSVEQKNWEEKTEEQKEKAKEDYRIFVSNHLTENVSIITQNNCADILKVLINKANGFYFLQDLEYVIQQSYYYKDGEILNFTLNHPDLKRIIARDGSYNDLLHTMIQIESSQGLNLIKYFFNEDELKIYMKPLNFLKAASDYNRIDIIKFLILENKIIQTNKIKSLIGDNHFGINNQLIADLFRQQGLLLCKNKLEQELSILPMHSQPKI